jgi:hypothetical protein
MSEHLRSRGVNLDLYPDIKVNEEERVTYFPLWNLSGQLTGYQIYRPDEEKGHASDIGRRKYHTVGYGVFGLNNWNSSDDRLFVTEGAFKATALHRLGYNAIAVLTSTPKSLRSWFYILGQKLDLIAIGDNDPAGQKLVTLVQKGFTSPIDIDEMDDYNVHEMIEKF